MRGISRAALALAGCVGLALLVPGVALAAASPVTAAECAAQGKDLVPSPDGTSCVGTTTGGARSGGSPLDAVVPPEITTVTSPSSSTSTSTSTATSTPTSSSSPGSTTVYYPVPVAVPDYYAGYWEAGYDVDCDELTDDEAQAVLALDRSDPFDLDRDRDGTACDRNHHRGTTAAAYPSGGVATGDGSTPTAASTGTMATASSLVSALVLTGAALVRRHRRES